MPELDGRTVWSTKTERAVTWLVLVAVALVIIVIALAFWRLRG